MTVVFLSAIPDLMSVHFNVLYVLRIRVHRKRKEERKKKVKTPSSTVRYFRLFTQREMKKKGKDSESRSKDKQGIKKRIYFRCIERVGGINTFL